MALVDADEYDRIIERSPRPHTSSVLCSRCGPSPARTSTPGLLNRLPQTGAVVQGPGERCAIDIGDGFGRVRRSHHHPCSSSPSGRGHRVVGILRDIFRWGPADALSPLRFGDPATSAPGGHRGFVSGISWYGTAWLPDRRWRCLRASTPATRSSTSFRRPRAPMIFRLARGLATPSATSATDGRDGIHGDTMAPATFASWHAAERRPTVQVGDTSQRSCCLKCAGRRWPRPVSVSRTGRRWAGLCTS